MKWLLKLDPGRLAVVVDADSYDDAKAMAQEIVTGLFPDCKNGWVHEIRRIGPVDQEAQA